ncbi:MAG TPA: hypothetical protein VNL71_19910 [Chloroflexota bacterium]|nr:hypothetical protein [Chloroflexota bacterium]
MITGARLGIPTWPRRLVAAACARALAAFVVPGPEIAAMYSLDLAAAGLRLVSTPRHAGILVVIGDLPDGLARAAAVAYAQMPRPRAILALGGSPASVLPAPDVVSTLSQDGLVLGVAQVRRRFATGDWALDVAPFTLTAPQPADGDEHAGMDHGGIPMAGPAERRVDAPQAAPSHAMHNDPTSAGQAAVPSHYQSMKHEMHGGSPAETAAPDRASSGTADEQHGAMSHPEPAHGDTSAHAESDMAMDGGRAPMSAPPGGAGGDQRHEPRGAAHPDEPKVDHAAMGHDMRMNHDSMSRDHGGMEMGGGMSMMGMTKDLPRSADGLPMEWIEAPFGPLFPGLPGGLALVLTLDGDTVAQARLTPGVVGRGLATNWPGTRVGFPDRLSRLDALAPVAYRLLGTRALEAAAGVTPNEATRRGRIGAIERERAVSHLGWVARLGWLLGDTALAREAAAIQHGLLRPLDPAMIRAARVRANALARGIERRPLLARRLRGIGRLDRSRTAELRGPVARAAGLALDARAADAEYQALGFAPIIRQNGDALARLLVRLEEVVQSLDLLAAVTEPPMANVEIPAHSSGEGVATLETPRGVATLRLRLETGTARAITLDPPSVAHAALVPSLATGQELADALVAVASLDLSPWEIDQ